MADLDIMPTFLNITFDDQNISFQLSDKRVITIPVHWIPKLEKTSKSTRENYVLRGHFVFWEEVDEIIGVKNLLNGSIVPG